MLETQDNTDTSVCLRTSDCSSAIRGHPEVPLHHRVDGIVEEKQLLMVGSADGAVALARPLDCELKGCSLMHGVLGPTGSHCIFYSYGQVPVTLDSPCSSPMQRKKLSQALIPHQSSRQRLFWNAL